MRQLLALFAAFTIGALAVQSVQAPRIECAYHTGYDEGWRDASKPMEDQPGWDCHTMGNKRCTEGK